ncbi:MAG TPA: hypothetical protein VGG74_27240 [Kofleriaceae bacterium]
MSWTPPLTKALPQLSRSEADILDMLSFQRLHVYQRAIEFLALVYEVVDELPRGHAIARTN